MHSGPHAAQRPTASADNAHLALLQLGKRRRTGLDEAASCLFAWNNTEQRDGIER